MSHMFYIKALNTHNLDDYYTLERIQFAIQDVSTSKMLSASSRNVDGFYPINNRGEIAIPLHIEGRKKDIENRKIKIYVKSPSSGFFIQTLFAQISDGLNMGNERFFYKVPTYSIKEKNEVHVTVYMGDKKHGKVLSGKKIYMKAQHKVGRTKTFDRQVEYTQNPLTTNAQGKVALSFSFWNSPCTIQIWHEQSGKWILPKKFTLQKFKTDYIYEITEWQEKKSETKAQQTVTKLKTGKDANTFIDMKTGEIILMPPKDAVEVINESKMLSDTTLRINQLKLEQKKKGEQFALALKENNTQKVQEIGYRIDCIEGEISALSQFLAKELKDIKKSEHIRELLPLSKDLKKHGYVYVPHHRFKSKAGKWDILPAVDLDYTSYAKKNRHPDISPIEFYKKKLKEDIKKSIDVAGPQFKKDVTFIDECLFQWVDDSAKVGPFIRTGDAQILRFSMGVGAAADYNLATGMIKANMGARASAALIEGRSSYDTYLPHAAGWVIGYQKELFRYRFKIGFDLTGFAGASVALEAGIEFIPQNGGVKGVPGKIKTAKDFAQDYKQGNPPPRNAQTASGQSAYARPTGPANSIKAKKAIDLSQWQEGDNVSVEASAFIGISAGIQARGGFEVLLVDRDGKDQGWKTLAQISFTLDLRAGFGADLSFTIKYHGGKLYGHMALGLCVGVGGKGRTGFEINIGTIVTFAIWMVTNLDRIGLALLEKFVDEKAYNFLVGAQKSAMVEEQSLSDFSSIADIEKLNKRYGFSGDPTVIVVSNPKNTQKVVNSAKRGLAKEYFLPEAKAYIMQQIEEQKRTSGVDIREAKALDYTLKQMIAQIQSQQELAQIQQARGLDLADYHYMMASLPEHIGLYLVSNSQNSALVDASQQAWQRCVRHGMVCDGIEKDSDEFDHTEVV